MVNYLLACFGVKQKLTALLKITDKLVNMHFKKTAHLLNHEPLKLNIQR